MARPQRNPTLFEVLGQSNRPMPDARAPEKHENGHPDPVPEPQAQEAPPVTEADLEAIPETWSGGRSLRIPLNAVLLTTAVVVGVVAVTWIVAWRLGEQTERGKWSKYVGESQEASPAPDPLVGGSGPDPVVPESGGNDLDRSGDGSRASQPTPDSDHATPSSWIPGTEPRKPGHNYLLVTRLPWDQAVPAAAFLTDQGIPAAALPADSSVDFQTAADKNLDHHVVVLEGFPRESFSSRAARRRELQQEVSRLGRIWRRGDGFDDFAIDKHLWERFDG